MLRSVSYTEFGSIRATKYTKKKNGKLIRAVVCKVSSEKKVKIPPIAATSNHRIHTNLRPILFQLR